MQKSAMYQMLVLAKASKITAPQLSTKRRIKGIMAVEFDSKIYKRSLAVTHTDYCSHLTHIEVYGLTDRVIGVLDLQSGMIEFEETIS